MSSKNNRWRDGSAKENPPPTDTEQGDETVTLASAQIGTETRLVLGQSHINLPDAAQDHVLELLGLDAVAEQFDSDLPKKNLFGITILSPIEVVVDGPNGEILSPTQNTFGEDVAEYDDDPDDPDDPIDINFADLPEGKYTITYTGTGEGEYTIITTYADDDEVVSTTIDGTTSLGQITTSNLFITPDSIIMPPADILNLLQQLKQSISSLKHDKHLDKKASKKLNKHAKHLVKQGEKYQKEVDKHGFEHKHISKAFNKLQKEFAKFNKEFDKQIDKSRLDDTAILELTGILNQLTAAGL